MGLPNGVHHLAICTKDIKGQIEFFTQVVGMELVALYWMHGVDNTFHGFLKLNDSSSIAFVESPEIGEIQGVKGVSHAGSPARPVAVICWCALRRKTPSTRNTGGVPRATF